MLLTSRRKVIPVALAAAAYLLLTVVLTWPLVLSPASLVPHDLGDPLLNAWIMWWNARAIPLTTAWWNAPQFFPVQGAFGFSEHLLGLAPITTPIILATGDALLAYNVALMLSFPLCGLGAYFLSYSITRRHDVSFVCGLAFAFAPYRVAQLPHVQVLSSYWMPVTLAALHRYFTDEARSTRWLVLFAAAWVMQALACGYYFFYLSVLIVLWLVWFAIARVRTRDFVRVGFAWILGAVLLAPVMYGYWSISKRYNLRRGIDEISAYSADIASLLHAPRSLLAWGWLDVVVRPESEIFPGLTVVLVAAVALVFAWRTAARQGGGVTWIARGALILGLVFLVITAARFAFGPYKLRLGEVSIVSVTAPHKPLSIVTLMFAIVALLHPSVRYAWRVRSPLAFYSLAAVIMWVLCLGPAPTLLEQPALYKAPYAWLMLLPGLDGIRVPARFWMLAVLCLAVAAALALRFLSERWPRAGQVLVPLACLGILVDGWPAPVAMLPRPAPRPNHSSAKMRLDVPPTAADTVPLFRATEHGRALVNGYSGYFPPQYDSMIALFRARNPDILQVLARYGSLEVMIDHSLDADGGWRSYLARQLTGRELFSNEEYTSYRVASQLAPPRPPLGALVPISSFSVVLNPHLVSAMTDGDLNTRWHAGRGQQRGDWMIADLGAVTEVAGAELLIAGYAADYPRDLIVETSEDGTTWTRCWEGSGALAAYIGALERPLETPVGVYFDPRPARYVRFVQMGEDPVMYWTVAELRIFAAGRR